MLFQDSGEVVIVLDDLKRYPDQEKKEKIIRAALEIFSQKLFHQVAISEVAAASGVGKGTIYIYFDSKEALFREVIKYSYNAYYESLKECLEAGKSARDKLKRIMDMQKEVMQTQKKFVYMLAKEKLISSLILEEEAFQCQQEMIDLVSRVIEEGIKEGEFRNMDPDLAAKIFMGGVAALWYSAYVYESKEALEQNSVDEIMNIVYNGFCAGGVVSGGY